MSSGLGKRRTAPPMVGGSSAAVRPEDVEELARLRADLDRLRGRISTVTARIKRQMGTAEFGVDGQGEILVRRDQAVTGGAYVRVNHRDDLKFGAR